MLNDFKMIVSSCPTETKYINLYPIADAHIGSQEFNETKFKEWLEIVKADGNALVTLSGDLLNNGIKSSKTNCYEETMRPQAQKEYLYNALLPIKEKILAACGGNHEYRNIKEVDNDPLYDVMCWLQIGERYRQNICFVKLSLGRVPRNGKPVTYGVVLTHGASRNKHDKFINGIDGADVFISGHTHQNEYQQPSKIRMDTRNNKVSFAPYRKVVCIPFQESGGYSIRGEYMPGSIDEFQVLKLSGERKKINFFTL